MSSPQTESLHLTAMPMAETGMLIRKPVAEVFEAVVNPDGTVGAARVVRSLDNRFGLDEKAIEAVRQWRFRPALRFGRPVAVRVVIELTFTLR